MMNDARLTAIELLLEDALAIVKAAKAESLPSPPAPEPPPPPPFSFDVKVQSGFRTAGGLEGAVVLDPRDTR